VFFAFVIDAFSRRVVGWQFAAHLRTDLARRAADGTSDPKSRRRRRAGAPQRRRHAIHKHVAWFNDQRPHQSLDDLPQAEFEALYARQTGRNLSQIKRGNQLTRAPRDPGRLTLTYAHLVGRERKASAAPAEAAARLTIAQPTTAPPDWRYGRTQCPRPRAAFTWGAAVAPLCSRPARRPDPSPRPASSALTSSGRHGRGLRATGPTRGPMP
jgi:hypothetical protein